MGPPERVLLQDLVLLEVLSHTPSLVVGQCQPIFLEECVYPWHASIPGVLQIIQCQAAILRLSFFPLESVLSPHSLGVDVLALPGLDVPVQVRNHLIVFVFHPSPEVGRASILGLLSIS